MIDLVALVSACGGGNSGSTDTDNGGGSADSGENEDTPQSSATPDPADLFPESIVMHPDAYDIEVTKANGAYVYLVPMMVKETTEYL